MPAHQSDRFLRTWLRVPVGADDGSMPPSVPSADTSADQATTIDQTLQLLFSCCLTLCRASREAEHKDELIRSTIEELDKSIRLLRSAGDPA